MEFSSKPSGERNSLTPEVVDVSISGLIWTRFIQSVPRQFSLVAARNRFSSVEKLFWSPLGLYFFVCTVCLQLPIVLLRAEKR